jgi:uncharacterized protein YraI
MIRQRFLAITLAVFVITLYWGLATAHSQTFQVIGNVSEGILNMRDGPGTGHSLIVSIPAGATGIKRGNCQSPDDNGTKPWCKVRWQNFEGWVSSCCIIPETVSAQEADNSYPMVFTKAADLRRLGIAMDSYGVDSKYTKAFETGCYYYGDGGYGISLSDQFLDRFRVRGFSRRSLCMALVSQAKFDPETGRRLPTYILVNPQSLALHGGKGWPGDVTDELPLDVPDCFKNGLPYTDCQMQFDMMSGQRISTASSHEYKLLGAYLEQKLGSQARRNAFRYMESSNTRQIMVGATFSLYDDRPGNRASFYDYSNEFQKGYGYALNADGAAAPDPTAEAVQLALEGKRRVSEAQLKAMEDALSRK